MSFEAYKIAVHLGFTSNGVGLLGALGAKLFDVESKVKSLTGSFNRMHLAMYGGLALIGGAAMIKGIEAVVNKTKDLSNELVKLERLGGAIGTAAASGELTKRAFEISQRVPMNVVDLLKIPGASYSIVGQQSSMEIWEELAKFAVVLQSQEGFKGDVGKELQKLLRSSELTGRLTDPKTHEAALPEMRHFLDLASRVIAATHGMVNPSTLLGMAQQGGFSMRGLTDEGFYTQAIMAQAMGGPRSGTALLSLWQQMAGGVMFKRSAEGLQDIGMLGKDEWKTDHGRVILGDAASKRLTSMLGKDPLDFAANMIEKLKERGITEPEDQMRKVMRALGRQTTQRYTAEQITNFQQMIAERERLRGGLGAGESFGTIMNKDVSANLKAMHEAWNNLLYAVAGPNSENTIKLLQSMTSALNSMSSTINQMNPETVQGIAKGFAILAATLVGTGAVALLAAIGPAGWLVLGLGALAAAIVGMKGLFTTEKKPLQSNGSDVLSDPDRSRTSVPIIPARPMTNDDWFRPEFKAYWNGVFESVKSSFVNAWNDAKNSESARVNLERWNGLKDWVSSIGQSLAEFWASIKTAFAHGVASLKEIAASISSEISSWPGRVAAAIAGMGSAIVNAIKGAFSGMHLPSWLGGSKEGEPAPTPQKSGFYSPSNGRHGDQVLHAHLHMDGEKIGHAVTRIQTAWATHPNAVGDADSHGSYRHPGTWVPDAVG